MAANASESRLVAVRYARALFDLATEQKALDAVEKDLRAVLALFAEGDTLTRFVSNPTLSRADAGKGVDAILTKLGVSNITTQFFKVLAGNRRLDISRFVIESFLKLLADSRNEVAAHVTSAKPLSSQQLDEISGALAKGLGKKVTLTTDVDAALLGGVIIKAGSTMIDHSVKGRLDKLATTLKASAA